MAIGTALGAIGSLAGSAISAFGRQQDNGNWFDNHPIESAIFSATLSKQMQKDLMNHQYDLNSKLAQNQFEYNKYFTEHGHQAETADLRAAGLNPILSANNGAYSQVGLGSVGLGSASTPDIMQGSSAMSNAKSQRAMARLKGAELLSDLMVKKSTSSLQNAQADVERAKVHNVNMDTDLKGSQIVLNNINTEINKVEKQLKDYQNLTKEERWDLEKKYYQLEKDKLKIMSRQADASMINADANRTSAVSNAAYNERRSGGYTDSIKIGPFSYTHSGDGGKNSRWQTHYEKLPNGKIIEVRSYE